MTTDDLKDIPHVVIEESAAGIRLVEFEGTGCDLRAHEHAMKVAAGDFHGRVIVACRIRTLQPFAYLKQHENKEAKRSDAHDVSPPLRDWKTS